MPQGSLQNVNGAWGGDTQNTGQAYATPYPAATTVSAGYVVALSTTTAQVTHAATNQAIASVLGIALSAASAGQVVQVIGDGPAFNVKKDTSASVVQFDLLTIAATDTGTLTPLGATTAITQMKDIGKVVAIAMAAAITTASTISAVKVIRW